MPSKLRHQLSRKSKSRRLFDAISQIASFAFAGIFMILTLQVAFPNGMFSLWEDLAQQPQLARHSILQEFHALKHTPISRHTGASGHPANQDVARYQDARHLNNLDV